MSFADRDGVIWLDGEMVDWREAKVHVLTHTLHYGMGVFEGVRAYETDQGPAIFRLQEHTDRLFNSAKILDMTIPFSKEALNEAQIQAVKQNNLSSAYLRPMCFYGSEGMGLRADNLQTHVMVAAWSWGAYLGDDGLNKGIRIKTSSFTRHHVNVTMCKAKANGNYKGSGENIFLVRNGVIYTPDLTSALDGITRNTIFVLAKECGLEIVEKRITRDEVYIADEVFFTGSAAEVTPVREVDNRTIGNGGRGPITEKLQSLYFDVVQGRSEAHKEWLTLCE